MVVRCTRLRWPLPSGISACLGNKQILGISRRAKYLLLHIADTVSDGHLLLHLGMSGSLRVLPENTPPGAHDHLDIVLDNGRCLRLRDPRRFGSVHWINGNPQQHPLLCVLGPEPLTKEFSGEYLYQQSRHRRTRIKCFLMNGRIVAGIGNIYANEALFQAGIHPARAAGRISLHRYQLLHQATVTLLKKAIRAGGTTLRDFTRSDGQPGYFRLQLSVYDRAGEPCTRCQQPLRIRRDQQRSTYYCTRCQR